MGNAALRRKIAHLYSSAADMIMESNFEFASNKVTHKDWHWPSSLGLSYFKTMLRTMERNCVKLHESPTEAVWEIVFVEKNFISGAS